jgi:hypothetical protein
MVRKLYGDSLALEQRKKETEDDRSQDQSRRVDLPVRLRHRSWLPLRSLHLQELQLLSG